MPAFPTSDPSTSPSLPSYNLAAGSRALPSVAGFWIGGVLIVAGFVAAIAVFVIWLIRISDAVGDLERVPMGETTTITLEEVGGYTIYHEHPGAGSATSASEATVSIEDSDGQPIPTAPYEGSVTYSFDHEGRAIATFSAPHVGRYEITTSGAGRESLIAIGPSIGPSSTGGVVLGVVLSGITLAVGVLLLIITGMRRSQAQVAAALAALPDPPVRTDSGEAPGAGRPAERR